MTYGNANRVCYSVGVLSIPRGSWFWRMNAPWDIKRWNPIFRRRRRSPFNCYFLRNRARTFRVGWMLFPWIQIGSEMVGHQRVCKTSDYHEMAPSPSQQGSWSDNLMHKVWHLRWLNCPDSKTNLLLASETPKPQCSDWRQFWAKINAPCSLPRTVNVTYYLFDGNSHDKFSSNVFNGYNRLSQALGEEILLARTYARQIFMSDQFNLGQYSLCERDAFDPTYIGTA